MVGKLGSAQQPFRVAIIGAGPSGFYAAEALLQSGLTVEVDMLERLPVPYGLVRFGVAPDHAKLKTVTKVFEQIASHPCFRFIGNVELGRDVSVRELDDRYHAVIVATGASSDKKLGIRGEELPGVHAASSFVGWYNGQPECRGLEFDLSHEVAVVVGQGNVAIDVCRILAKPLAELRKTDITEHALDVLATSRIRRIHVIGRRGAAQAKFTHKELREIGALPGWRPVVNPDDLQLNAASAIEISDPSAENGARNIRIMEAFAGCPDQGERTIHFNFQYAPTALLGVGKLETVRLERQRLAGTAFHQRAEPTGEFDVLEAGLLLRSVGYRGVAIPDLPFDQKSGVLPNREGRIVDEAGLIKRGWYATGWIKRGPTGIIGTNRQDSVETVVSVIGDLPALEQTKMGRSALLALLTERSRRAINFDDWRAIEAAEKERGNVRGKVAEKFVHVSEMLAVASSAAYEGFH